MTDKIVMPKVISIPDPLEKLAEKDQPKWGAKREVTQKLKEIIELMVTSDPQVDQLERIAGQLQQTIDTLETAPHYYGKVGFLEDGGYEAFGDVSHELSPLSGLSNALAPPVKLHIENGQANGSVFCGWAYEGPPGTIHGGYVAAIFDQFLGMAQLLGEQPGMTGRLTVHYHARSPLNKELKLRAWVERQDGRKTIIHGEMYDGDIKTASCEGLFVAPRGGVHKLRPLNETVE